MSSPQQMLFGLGGLPTPFTTWQARAIAAGGSFGGSSQSIALGLINALIAESYYSKIKSFYPFLGGDLTTARVPLIDVLNAGIATNNGLVGGDFSEATGIQFNGAKTLNTLVKASQLGSSGNGGIGFGIRTFGTGGWTIGSRDAGVSEIYGVLIDSAETMYWGHASTSFNSGAAGGSKRYHVKRASATDRKFYANSSQTASSTASGATLGIATNNIFIGGLDTSFMCNHQFSYAYMMDGTESNGDIAALDALIGTYLITPTGR